MKKEKKYAIQGNGISPPKLSNTKQNAMDGSSHLLPSTQEPKEGGFP